MIFKENATIHYLEKNDTISIDASNDDDNERFSMTKRNSHLVEVESYKDENI